MYKDFIKIRDFSSIWNISEYRFLPKSLFQRIGILRIRVWEEMNQNFFSSATYLLKN